MPRKSITIHGDGSDAVFVDEDGNTLDGVYSAVIRMQAREPTTVELEIIMPRTVIKSAVVTDIEFLCPVCENNVSHQCGGGTLSGT